MKSKKVKVLIKTSLGHNGIASVTMNYFKNMPKDKINVDFAICDDNNDIRKDFSDYVKSRESRILMLPRPSLKGILEYLIKMKQILHYGNYEVVHINGNSGNMLLDVLMAKICGVKIIVTHCHNTSCKYRVLHYVFKPFLNWLVTDKIACSSTAGKWVYNNNQFSVLQNGIDFNEYKFKSVERDYIRNKYNLFDEFVICHAGGFLDAKNHTYLIDIFKEIHEINPRSKLLLIGEGPLRGEIEEKVIKSGLENQVIFVGNTTNISKYYSASDVFILPSKFEGLPLVLIEAQVNGLPCIIADNITKEVDITGSVQYLSIQSHPNKWAEKVVNIFRTNSRSMIKYKDNARLFDIKESSIRLEKFYVRRFNEEYVD
ncbi:glycosyltransferase [Clostridium folliculivorans]|uniref:glycosyltransferase n=1 Tax=Clostridium folliculivorans TaxID=2886038 RepID=UPI0021C4153D|nr:glycosyltransferase [Clostridium folliculivorans]GKU31640.1 glycosyl transferase family 1 [Clostridium folliculivorans]